MTKQRLNKQQFKKFILNQCNPTGKKIYPPLSPPKFISITSYIQWRDGNITPIKKIEDLLNKMGYQIETIEISKKK